MTAEPPFLLAIDQGTTSTRAILFDAAGAAVGLARHRMRQIYPDNGWVEHDAEEIWQAALAVCRVASHGVSAEDIAAHRHRQPARDDACSGSAQTGTPLHNAIVWQDRRTAERADAESGRARSAMSRAAPDCCSTPISPPPRRNGCSTMFRARAPAPNGRTGARHDRQLADLQADRRAGARDRRHQCLAHAAAGSEHARLGR